jgi:HEAT repeat protein
MRTMKKHFLLFGLLAVGAVQTLSAPAEAAPVATSMRMPANRLAELKVQVAKARTLDARVFTNVNTIVNHAPEADARARGRKGATALVLAKLGPSALMPMLEMLAIDSPHGIPEESAASVRRDVIEAVGLLKDARALPVLDAILSDASEDAATTRTTAEAVARIGTDEAATKILAALDASTGERTHAIIAGMGDCRHLRVTEALATRLRTTNDAATARAAARSLGRAGNAWAWKTVADRSEENPIRTTSAKALLDSFVRRSGEERTAASNALMVVDAPETPALIAEAKRGASPDLAKALDALSARFARNPSRTQ